jgi:hypothetical protein
MRGPECTYERCALGYGPGLDTMRMLERAGGEVARLYRASRGHQSRSAALTAPYLVSTIATLAYYASDDTERSAWKGFPAPGFVLPASTLLLAWASKASAVRAEEELSRAIWLYNRDLPHTDPPVFNCTYERCAVRLEHHFWTRRLVQGWDSRWIGRLGGRERIAIFDQSPDGQVRSSYDAFLASQRRARSKRWISLGLYLGAGVVFAVTDGKGSQIGGTGLIVLGNWVGHQAMDAENEARAALDLAIWHYNRGLTDGP